MPTLPSNPLSEGSKSHGWQMLLLSSQVRALSLILLDLKRNRTSSAFLQCYQRKTPARALVNPPPLRCLGRGP